MPWLNSPGIPFVYCSGMLGYPLVLKDNHNPLPVLLYFHPFAYEPLWDRVTIGVHVYKSLYVNNPVDGLENRRDIRRKGPKVGFLHHVSLFRSHTQRSFGLCVGYSIAPAQGLGIEIGPVFEGASGKKVVLHIAERALNTGLTIRMSDAMRQKGDT